METLLSFLGSVGDLLLVILGFSLIVFLHELGHFVAARWAGIRVLAFALGFGPAVVSFRKGLGWRRGSSEREYHALLTAAAAGPTAEVARAAQHAVSPTEYRLNALPFGGYVRMLGQDDLDPSAVSSASDSYQSAPVWKRMIVISAGVVANIISAAAMFVLVFMIGLRTEPAVIGDVQPGSPAAQTSPTTGAAGNAENIGLKPGDVVTSINGRAPNSFNDLVLATAMAGRDESVNVVVRREGRVEPLEFNITPRQSTVTKLLDIGVGPSLSTRLASARTPAEQRIGEENLARIGLPGVKPGMSLVSIDGRPVTSGHDLDDAIRSSRGRTLKLVFASDSSEQVFIELPTRPEFESDLVPRGDDTVAPQRHVAGLAPVMMIREAQAPAIEQGLRDGDIFARLGTVEYPSTSQGMQEIKAAKNKTLPVVVLRRNGDSWEEVSLDVRVSSKGTIGFFVGETEGDNALVALPPALLTPAQTDLSTPVKPYRPAAADAIFLPGTRITAVNEIPVQTLGQVRELLRTVAVSALAEDQEQATVSLTIEPPRRAGAPNDRRPTETVRLELDAPELRRLFALSWTAPVGSWIFEPTQFLLKAKNPVDAIHYGLDETRRVMMTTYLTFARLFEGTVKVEHLKGPVGIAHVGTRLVDRGMVWLLFFMALISVNLAVINFLPLPIVDGGQFVLLVLEQVRGRPIPIPVQNAVTLAGLVMIGSVFLFVTFNDLRQLFGL
ncbi:MAG: site-2 protease family protein [Phycisphaerales bacterium]|nr:site-2 protease family protein [Phycisphaerales bacterium]